jgi:hypothetical protein
MATFHRGYKDIRVELVSSPGNDFAKKVYEFGRLSHDFYIPLQEEYYEHSDDCKKLIGKIIAGTTLPKFALQGLRFTFRIEGISRICLAQLTRDPAFFASASTGVFPLTQDFNLPISIYDDKEIMEKLEKAQSLLEEAYIMACEKEIPSIEARYVGLHCQTISLTASFVPSDFVRACYSRTSSNFCDECNYVYRLMYKELMDMTCEVTDVNSLALYNWIFAENKCINDGLYRRERLFNSDFTEYDYEYELPALNDWRKSGWKKELEEMYKNGNGFLTDKEQLRIEHWMDFNEEDLPTTYDDRAPDVLINMIKTMPYYKEHRND